MKTPLGTEVDLGPGHFVLDGEGDTIDMGRKEGGLLCPLRGGAGAQQRSSPLPSFGPCLLCPRSPISATAELLSSLLSDVETQLSNRT